MNNAEKRIVAKVKKSLRLAEENLRNIRSNEDWRSRLEQNSAEGELRYSLKLLSLMEENSD